MEQVWTLTLLKDKRVPRQQMSQAVVELQRKAVTIQYALTILVASIFHTNISRISRIVRAGKSARGQRVLPEAKSNSITLLQAMVPNLFHVKTLGTVATIFQPFCAGRRDGWC